MLWTLVLAVVFVLGAAFGQTQRGIRWTRTVRALVAKNVNTGEPKVVPSQSRPAPKARP